MSARPWDLGRTADVAGPAWPAATTWPGPPPHLVSYQTVTVSAVHWF